MALNSVIFMLILGLYTHAIRPALCGKVSENYPRELYRLRKNTDAISPAPIAGLEHPIFVAVKSNNIINVVSVIEKDDRANLCDGAGNTPLHYAIKSENTEIAEQLLKHKAVVDAIGAGQNTPLHFAALNKDPVAVKLLMKHGASINRQNSYGDTPVHLAFKPGKRVSISEASVERTVEALLGKHLSLGDRIKRKSARHFVSAKNVEEETPLLLASIHGLLKPIKLLLAHGASVHECNSLGESVLLNLIKHGADVNVVKLLLEKGALPNNLDNTGTSPLMWAADRGNRPVAELLVAWGANVNIISNSWNTALHFASGLKRSINVLIFLVELAGANIEVKNNENLTPLLVAVKAGNYSAVHMLLKYGAQPIYDEKDPGLVVKLGKESGNNDIVDLLCKVYRLQVEECK